ncbi:hypothetical protein PPYR_07823 [Photinus pyralis]|uniref:peptidylprolyl isomerase n=1 Tax=Photinus pyralis TaxID=7054 RepID=A0A1Y1N7S5_PHOPY|nr:FK506-binding protein 59 [Photinus pyralis]KAB0799943.1 hypothetical protein PPYR_07823 [Photinus pyralis]
MANALDISPKGDGGVLKEILVEGDGEKPSGGCKVKVHYTGTLLDGTQFDSSRERNSPFEFDLGKGSVIKAWDIGVATMKKGERAMLTCAPEYAYGEAGSPPNIPPNSTLKFDVEVLEWEGEDLSPKKDKSIERFIIDGGEGYTSPNEGAQVEVHLVGKYNETVFEERDVAFALGEGSEENVIDGVERALSKFKKGEKSELIIQSKYAFGDEGSKEFNIPPGATVRYIVTLKTFEKMKESWSMDAAEKIEQAKLLKDKGTKYYKDGKLNLAIKMYKRLITNLDADSNQSDEKKSLKLSANLNLSLCYYKLKEYFETRQSATAAIELDSKSVKAFFRRGQALLALGEPELASKDFAVVLDIEPDNTAAKAQQALCAKTLKQQLEKEKRIYANMFDKFAKMDAQKEEDEKKKQPDVMSSLGEWGKEDRHREPSEFEKENPNILMLNGSGEFKDM